MEAVIYIGHGNRSPVGRQAYLDFIQNTMEAVQAPIKKYCFYERAEPTLSEAVEQCVQKGATNIQVIPVLLLPGKQTSEEMPNDINIFEIQYPEVSFVLGEPIGVNPVMFEIVRERLNSQSFLGSEKEAVVLVSHGSHDPLASLEFNRLADALSDELKVSVQTGYIVTEPNYHIVCQNLLKVGYEKVYIVPYFFFAGVFFDEMKATETENMIICDELGYDEKIIQLLMKAAL